MLGLSEKLRVYFLDGIINKELEWYRLGPTKSSHSNPKFIRGSSSLPPYLFPGHLEIQNPERMQRSPAFLPIRYF